MTDLIILSSLLSGPRHGYEIKKVAGAILGEGELHNNLVYPWLHRFERKGWVERRRVPGDRGQTRFEYRLTRKGRAEIVQRLAHYPDSGREDGEFYLRVGLFAVLPPEARQRILDVREQDLCREVERFRRLRAEFACPPLLGGEILRFLERRAGFELDWMRSLRRLATSGNGTAASGGVRGKPGAKKATEKSRA